MVEGNEMTRYRNIDIPESLKDLEIQDFGFQILADGKIEFNLHFNQDILPAEFPGVRPKMTRAEKAAAKVAVMALLEAEARPEAETRPEGEILLEAEPQTEPVAQPEAEPKPEIESQPDNPSLRRGRPQKACDEITR